MSNPDAMAIPLVWTFKIPSSPNWLPCWNRPEPLRDDHEGSSGRNPRSNPRGRGDLRTEFSEDGNTPGMPPVMVGTASNARARVTDAEGTEAEIHGHE